MDEQYRNHLRMRKRDGIQVFQVSTHPWAESLGRNRGGDEDFAIADIDRSSTYQSPSLLAALTVEEERFDIEIRNHPSMRLNAKPCTSTWRHE